MREIKFKVYLQHEETGNIIEMVFGYDDIFSGRALGELKELTRYYVIGKGEYTGLKDKNGKEIYEGDIVGTESVYHFLEREGWEPAKGNWKIIGEKSKNFTRITPNKEEKYIAGYELKTVEWKTESCGFEPFSDSEDNCGYYGGGENPNNYEVLGNLYENPELLTDK